MGETATAMIAGEATSGPGDGETVSMTYAERALGQRQLVTSAGRSITVALAGPFRPKPGDRLRLQSGGEVTVVAAVEDLVVVTGPDLLRAAWLIGNRRAPCQIGVGQLTLLPEPALESALRTLGASVATARAAFVPDCTGPMTSSGFSVHHHGASHAKTADDDDDDEDDQALEADSAARR